MIGQKGKKHEEYYANADQLGKLAPLQTEAFKGFNRLKANLRLPPT
jgi:hypothetical protein